MSFHGLTGFADRPKTEVIGPTVHHLVELRHHCLMVQRGSVLSRLATDRLTDANHSLLGRDCAQISASRLCRVAAAKGVSSPGELHPEALAEPYMTLSRHTAPIRQTCRSYRCSSARKGPLDPWRALEERCLHGPCGLESV
jgi:hypothetical protein